MSRRKAKDYVLITGGCGFIGTNLADRLLGEGRPVLLYDNLSRPGVEQNLAYLRAKHGSLVDAEIADVRNARLLARAARSATTVFHFAAQVAVTTSLVDPRSDFEVNARGTLNVLEAARACSAPPAVIFTSTNKVYGALDDLRVRDDGNRYVPDRSAAAVSEQRPLDFHSPYGCSKGAADQYVLDYARSYRLPAVVFRMSCIYGPHQFGTEDQGWVAHFLIQAIEGQPITVYGDGKQVRDILFVEDLVEAVLAAESNASSLTARAFNIGGGVSNAISLLDLLEMIGQLKGRPVPPVTFESWRTGDQKYYVSDTTVFCEATGWLAKVGARAGVRRLYEWLLASRRRSSQPVTKFPLAAWPEAAQAETRAAAR